MQNGVEHQEKPFETADEAIELFGTPDAAYVQSFGNPPEDVEQQPHGAEVTAKDTAAEQEQNRCDGDDNDEPHRHRLRVEYDNQYERGNEQSVEHPNRPSPFLKFLPCHNIL